METPIKDTNLGMEIQGPSQLFKGTFPQNPQVVVIPLPNSKKQSGRVSSKARARMISHTC
jgi:hypothetical protein